MSLSMITRLIKVEVCITCRSWRLHEVENTKEAFDNCRYHRKIEFYNCFNMHTDRLTLPKHTGVTISELHINLFTKKPFTNFLSTFHRLFQTLIACKRLWFCEILVDRSFRGWNYFNYSFFSNVVLKLLSAKWRQFC